EISILAEHLDRERFRALVLSADPVDEPSPAAARLRALGITIDESCHKLKRCPSQSRICEGIPSVANASASLWPVRMPRWLITFFQGPSPEECRLIEHGGIVGEATRIPKEFTARYVGVSAAIAQAAAPYMVNPRHACWIPSMVDVDRYRGLDRAELSARLG